MQKKIILKRSAQLYIWVSIICLSYVALCSLWNPQQTMDLVSVRLDSTDAKSSIRGIYGGAGLTICLLLFYFVFKNVRKGLLFLAIFWAAYATSRVLTIFVDGPLGEFGSTWLLIESLMCFMAVLLFLLMNKTISLKKNNNT